MEQGNFFCMKIISYTYRFTLLYYLYTKKYDDFVILKLSFFFVLARNIKCQEI